MAGLKDLEIHLPNLISFKYNWSEAVVSFKNVPNLADVSFGSAFSDYITDNLCQLNNFLGQLHALKMCPLFAQVNTTIYLFILVSSTRWS